MIAVEEAYKVYSPNTTTTFILTDTKTIAKTNLQTFMLVPCRHNYQKRLAYIRHRIELGKITNLSQVVDLCGLKPGRRGQMLGIELVNIKLENYIREQVNNASDIIGV